MVQLFRQEALNRQGNRLYGNVSLNQPIVFAWLAGLLVIIVVVSSIFLATGTYKRKAGVIGVLQSQKGVVQLHTKNSGKLQQLLVQEGQNVTEGQTLFVLSNEQYFDEKQDLNGSLEKEVADILSNLEQEKNSQKERYAIQSREVEKRIIELQRQLELVKRQKQTVLERIELADSLVKQTESLLDQGVLSKLELINRKDTLLSLKQQSQSLETQEISYDLELQQQQSLKQQLPIDYQARVSEIGNVQSERRNQITRFKYDKNHVIKSPVDGVVTGISLKLDQYVTAGQRLVSILPEASELEVIAYVPTREIAFIAENQNALMRFDAFPYQRFGVHQGKVFEVSKNVLLPDEVSQLTINEPSYRIKIRLPAQTIHAYGEDLPLRVGMTLEADIVTEERSLLKWVFDPIFSLKGKL